MVPAGAISGSGDTFGTGADLGCSDREEDGHTARSLGESR